MVAALVVHSVGNLAAESAERLVAEKVDSLESKGMWTSLGLKIFRDHMRYMKLLLQMRMCFDHNPYIVANLL